MLLGSPNNFSKNYYHKNNQKVKIQIQSFRAICQIKTFNHSNRIQKQTNFIYLKSNKKVNLNSKVIKMSSSYKKENRENLYHLKMIYHILHKDKNSKRKQKKIAINLINKQMKSKSNK